MRSLPSVSPSIRVRVCQILCVQVFGKDTMAVIGYGVQGRAQSQNMRDNGVCAFTVSINPVELQTHYLCRDISLFSLPFCDISLPSLFPCACVGVFCALSK